jgi:hypothetical protein
VLLLLSESAQRVLPLYTSGELRTAPRGHADPSKAAAGNELVLGHDSAPSNRQGTQNVNKCQPCCGSWLCQQVEVLAWQHGQAKVRTVLLHTTGCSSKCQLLLKNSDVSDAFQTCAARPTVQHDKT